MIETLGTVSSHRRDLRPASTPPGSDPISSSVTMPIGCDRRAILASHIPQRVSPSTRALLLPCTVPCH